MQIGWISFAKFIAILFVVLLHSSAFYFNGFEVGSYGWEIGNIGNGLSRWAVPVFVMISGSLLLGRDYNIKDFYYKRVSKIIIPLLAWSVFYTIIWIYQNKNDATMHQAIINILSGKPFYHMWFLYMILGLYAITPVLNILIKSIERKKMNYIVTFLFLISIINITDVYINNRKESLWIFWFIQFIPYYLSGYFLSKAQITPSIRLVSSVIIIISISITLILSHVFSVAEKTQYFYEPLSPIIIVYSFSVFSIIASMRIKFNNTLANLSMGVYLSHPFYLLVFFKVFKAFSISHPLPGLILSWVTCSTLSFITVFAIKNIKYIKKIV